MNLQSWPLDESQTVPFSELVEPLIGAIEFCYKLERQNRGQDIPYTGYPSSETAVTLPTEDVFRADNMDYSEQDQGRSALEEIVAEALRIGMEQQRRLMLSPRGERYRSEYVVSAALEEAAEEMGLDRQQISELDSRMRAKLENTADLEALEDRRSARVSARLEEYTAALQKMQETDPEKYAKMALQSHLDRLGRSLDES